MRRHCDPACTGGPCLRTFWTFPLRLWWLVLRLSCIRPPSQAFSTETCAEEWNTFVHAIFHSVTTTLTPSPLSYSVKMDHFKPVFDTVGSTRAPKSSLVSHNQTSLITFSHVLHAQPASHSGTPNELYQEVSETAQRKAKSTPNTITGTSRTRTEPAGSGFIKWMQFTATTTSNDRSLLPNFCLLFRLWRGKNLMSSTWCLWRPGSRQRYQG